MNRESVKTDARDVPGWDSSVVATVGVRGVTAAGNGGGLFGWVMSGMDVSASWLAFARKELEEL